MGTVPDGIRRAVPARGHPAPPQTRSLPRWGRLVSLRGRPRMPTADDLRSLLRSLDGGAYREYKRIAGRYDFPGFELRVDHVQGDPFADPSRVRAVVPATTAEIPPELLRTDAQRTAVADFLNRAFAAA